MLSWKSKAKLLGAGAALMVVSVLSTSGYRVNSSLEDDFLAAMSKGNWIGAAGRYSGDADDLRRTLERHPEIWGASWRPLDSFGGRSSARRHADFKVTGRDHRDRLVHFDTDDWKTGFISSVIVDGKWLLPDLAKPRRRPTTSPAFESR